MVIFTDLVASVEDTVVPPALAEEEVTDVESVVDVDDTEDVVFAVAEVVAAAVALVLLVVVVLSLVSLEPLSSSPESAFPVKLESSLTVATAAEAVEVELFFEEVVLVAGVLDEDAEVEVADVTAPTRPETTSEPRSVRPSATPSRRPRSLNIVIVWE